jgi:heme A synthase
MLGLTAARGEADELVRFRRLLNATILATFALIVIGGVVRVSDSGLGCGAAGSGTEGWPLCGGRVLPFLQQNAVIEFSHRAAATIVVVLIAALALQAFRRLRDHTWLVRGTVTAAVLVLAQAVLGGLTVEHGLHSAFVAAHLGLAMLLLALLIMLHRIARPSESSPPVDGSRALRATAAVSIVLLFGTIVAGGYVAGTEGEGTPNQPILGAHLACGEQFPTCLNKFMPFSYGRLVDIQLTHRLFMYLTAISVLAMTAVALRRRARDPAVGEGFLAFLLAPALLALQILLGAMNVWFGKHPALIVAHLTLATLLWATVVYAAGSLLAVPAGARRRAEGAGTTQASDTQAATA